MGKSLRRSTECYFVIIPGNVQENSGERLKIFRGMFENIPMNVWKNSKKI